MSEVFSVAILGSGPAGLSAAARAAEVGLRHILLEKTDKLSDTIQRFQRGKLIMDTPVQLSLRSPLRFKEGKREKILENWVEDAAKHQVHVRFRADVTKVTGQKGDFTLQMADGSTVRAAHVVVAIGTQGNPNLMTCEGGHLPHVQYQLDDPGEYVDEHIFVVGGGDAGIENALGLVADSAQGNSVTLLNRTADFARAKDANVSKLMTERSNNPRFSIITEASTSKVEPGWITVDTPDGSSRLPCDRIIARMGTSPPRKFVESMGIEFTSKDRDAFPKLSPTFESTVPGIYVIGALAGYPLIKHCINQGYDAIEYINGVTDLKPADEGLLEERLKHLPGHRSVTEWIEHLRANVEILRGLSPLQMREFLLDAKVQAYADGAIIFEKGDVGSSLFGIADGAVSVHADNTNRAVLATIGRGSIFGEVGLISGRRRGATLRAAGQVVVIEIQRTAALKLMASNAEAQGTINRISLERMILQTFRPSLEAADIVEVMATAKVLEIKPDQAIITEGEDGYDLFIVRSGSMTVEKLIGDKTVFLNYVPANAFIGEMALIDGGRRTATVRAAIRSEVVKLDGEVFRKLLLQKPNLRAELEKVMARRKRINDYTEQQKHNFSSAVEMYSSRAHFLIEQGIGEATDVLLIDETLCIGCDNCEKACADAHDGLSRLDREAGRTYAHLHVPTSCRHCERPYCMTDCPPNAIRRGDDGEVSINSDCIGCGNCQRFCPYGVIRMDKVPPPKPNIFEWIFLGMGPGPGEPPRKWKDSQASAVDPDGEKKAKKAVAIKCDMCVSRDGRPACVKACPTGAAIRVSPEAFLTATERDRGQKGGGTR